MCADTMTGLLPDCCERLVAVDGVPVLYTLISGCNRSVPHMELIEYALGTLLNLAKVKTAAIFNFPSSFLIKTIK